MFDSIALLVVSAIRASFTEGVILRNEGSRLNVAYVREENEILQVRRLRMTIALQRAVDGQMAR